MTPWHRIEIGKTERKLRIQENGKTLFEYSDSAYHLFESDLKKGTLPTQTSVLGGDVGIHGIRNGMGWLGALHRKMDWTQGCIAVTNDEIDQIASLIQVGTRVSIRK